MKGAYPVSDPVLSNVAVKVNSSPISVSPSPANVDVGVATAPAGRVVAITAARSTATTARARTARVARVLERTGDDMSTLSPDGRRP